MNRITAEYAKLLFFAITIALLCYGFALTNYSLSVDNEYLAYPDLSLNMGRWGTNLIRYHIFHGQLPYFTLLISLVLFAAGAVELTKIFNFKGFSAYIFCALMVTFPQIAYQFIFIMQSDGIALGFLFSAIGIQLFIKSAPDFLSGQSLLRLVVAALLIMFITAIYQALILIPVVIYIIHIFQNTFLEEYSFKTEFKKALYFAGVLVASVILYYISVQIICPPTEESYLASYVSEEANNPIVGFLRIWKKNLTGSFYYGNRMFALATLGGLVILIKQFKHRKNLPLRALLLLLMFLLPYSLSMFITNNYHPPRLYVTTGIVLAFVIAYVFNNTKFEKQLLVLCALVCFTNIYFVTNLYYSNYRIANHDVELAKKIDALIQTKFADFNPEKDYVFFYGALPYQHHDKYRLNDSESFGGSLFSWDEGNNFRIVNLFRFQDVADYKLVDNKETYTKAVDAAKAMPVWPDKESIQKTGNIVVVKLGPVEGVKLFP